MTGTKMRILATLAGAAAIVTATNPAAAATLATAFDADNGNDGVMFDVLVKQEIALTGLGIHAAPGTYDYRIYYRAGGIGTAANDASAWTLLGDFSDTASAGYGNATLLDTGGARFAGGQTYGFYVTDTRGAFSIAYTDSLGAVGDTLAEDGSLAIRVGYGVEGAFGPLSEPRAANVAFTYAAVPEPASWVMMIAGFGIVGFATRRRRTVRFDALA